MNKNKYSSKFQYFISFEKTNILLNLSHFDMSYTIYFNANIFLQMIFSDLIKSFHM